MVRKLFNRLLCRHSRNYQCNQRNQNSDSELQVPRAKSKKRQDEQQQLQQQQQHLQQDLDDCENGEIIKVFGYKKILWKTIVSYVGILLTGGLLRLVFHWFPKFWISHTHDKAPLKSCDRLLVEDNYKGQWKTYSTADIETLFLNNGDALVYYLKQNVLKDNKKVISFTYKSVRYVLENELFQRLHGIGDGISQNSLHHLNGLSENEQNARLNVYGPNEIKVPLTSIFELILLEILTPFYVFQILSVIIWLTEGYIYFVIVIMTLTAFGIATYVYQTRQNQKNLRSQVKVKDDVHVFRKPLLADHQQQQQQQQNENGKPLDHTNDVSVQISSTQLIPGDLIALKEGFVYCDAILLNGNCLVDESMLTGESIQVLKTPIPNNKNQYQLEEANSHVLFAGTKIIQANGTLKALVTNTGFLTSKGTLVRSIMYPPPVDYAFDRDCTKYCFIMFFVGFLFAFYVAYAKSMRGIPLGDLIIKTLDSVTILLPAALPAAMTIGKLHALSNLKKFGIFCTNSKVMNVAGSVSCVCLDKTGTITEDKLDFVGVVLKGQTEVTKEGFVDFPEQIVRGMSTCHNLAMYKEELQGDPLEVQMFQVVNSKIMHGADGDGQGQVCLNNGRVLDVLERYQFSSNLRRMSVLVQSQETVEVFCKGSPEIIQSLCKDFGNDADQLGKLTKLGYRVLALACRNLDLLGERESLKTMAREQIETDLDFLGYLVFENKLKEGSRNIIKELHKGNLAIKMITGDNIETAISVAKECEILPTSVQPKVLTNLDQFGQLLTSQGLLNFEMAMKNAEHVAMTGNVWQQILLKDEDLLRKLLPKTQVFARMASNQKQQVIEELQALKYDVCMCGDGTNDCSALKAANVGISLTESESSIASPLTSKVPNISAVLEVIREGRAALVTTVSIVKICLAGNLIQYVALLLLYDIDASFSDSQFLYMDFHMLLYGFFIGYVDAYPGSLSSSSPTSSLLSLKPILSLMGYFVPTILFQFLALYLLRNASWFVPYVHNPEDTNNFLSYENFVVFIMALFQYTCMGVVFSKGKPFRKPMWTNWLLCLCMLLFLCINVSLTLVPSQWLDNFFDVQVPPVYNFRWVLVALGIGHLLSALVIEEIIVEQLIGTFLLGKLNVERKKNSVEV